jgi:hypothetical protein
MSRDSVVAKYATSAADEKVNYIKFPEQKTS